MQPSEQIKEYCNKVSQQIRWRKAKPMIAKEIEHHLCDQRDAYVSRGDNETNATEKAILQMGDAVFVGQELDKAHKPKPQWFLLAFTGLLMLIGLSINFWIKGTTHLPFSFSILPFVLAFGLFVGCYYMDFTRLGKHPKKIYAFILIVSIIGILFGTTVNGRLMWVAGRYTVSLSYLSLVFPLAFALFVYSMRKNGTWGILLCGIAYVPFAVILCVIPSTSGLLLYTITCLCVLGFSIYQGWFGVSKRQGLLLILLPTVLVLMAFAMVIVFTEPYVINRFDIFLNPQQDRFGAGYLYCLIREVLSKAVWFGKGDMPQNMGDITAMPNITTDYSLVFLVHQFGFVVLFVVTTLIVIFSGIAFRKAVKEKSVLGSLISLTIILTFMLQAVFYIADNLGYGLASSLSLPFISYGNTALFLNSALIGFMLSVFRTGEIFRDHSLKDTDNNNNQNSIFVYKDGWLMINLNADHS